MTILVVEDDYVLASELRSILQSEQFTVEVVHDGRIGLDKALQHNYDLIILDVMLPGCDGITVCQQLREQRNHAAILMLTVRSEVNFRVHGLQQGADDYLPKPFDHNEFIARVRALLRRPKQFLPSKLELGALSLNPATLEVQYHNTVAKLTPIEFRLLSYFMRFPNIVLPAQQLVSQAWGPEAAHQSNLLPVYIRRLRAKLKQVCNDQLIHSLRTTGYILKLTKNFDQPAGAVTEHVVTLMNEK